MFRAERAATMKGILASVAVLAVSASLLMVDFGAKAPSAQAADMSGFQAGNIIDDALFWDGYAMSESEIQSFLNSKVPKCASGITCLKNYTETTHTIEATPMCSRYEGQANESAARIIARVAQTCGVSPKVLLVTMQKEQGLVTKSSPGPGDFRSAMGAGCPDTAPCDSNYYGFFDQVHYGAYLLKRYTQPPGTGPGTKWTDRFDLRYPVGRTTAILTHPYPPTCDTIPVYIQNQATHALYIYTPYTPNQAALNAGYGFGDDCSSYGNRNFYNYYVDWFGSVRGFPVGVYFRDYYDANNSWLGYSTGPMLCGGPDSGCTQRFQGGLVAGSYSTAAAGVRNDYVQVWGWYGRELGPLGYPVSERRCDNMLNGCRQEFQGGWIVTFNGSDTYVVMQTVRQTWSDWGREYGPLGYPTTSGLVCDMGGGACRQEFQGGWIVQSSGRAVFVPNAVLDVWKSWGREYNILGLPTGSPSANPTTGNYSQTFQGGTITVTNGTPALTSATDPWISTTLTETWLGSSTQAKSCTLKNAACYQAFQNGWIVQSPTGVQAVPTAVLQGWGWYGREFDFLGFPTGSPSANPTTGNYTQTFQGGTITVTNGTPALTSATDPWISTTLTSTWLGSSTQAKSCTLKNAACYQAFQNGWIVQSPTGVQAVPTAVLQGWGWYGREFDFLGFPTGSPSANPTTGNYTQTFQGGTITVTNGTPALTSATDPWISTTLTSTWLGSSTQAKSCTLKNAACYQAFQNGWIVQSPTGVQAVPTAVLQGWGWYGREFDFLGFPTGSPSANPTTGNYTQTFQGGTITVTNGAPSVAIR